MGKTILNKFGKNGDMLFPDAAIGFLWCPLGDERYQSGSFFASVGQMGFRVSKNPLNSGSITLANLMGKYMMPEPSVQMDSGEIELKLSNSSRGIMAKNLLPESGIQMGSMAKLLGGEEWVLKEGKEVKNEKKKCGMKLKVKIGNPSLRRLVSGAIAGAISRTVVAPLETIRTHLMVGSCGHSSTEVFQNIIKDEGWQGLFKGNLVNVIRVAPSKAIELFAYDTVKKQLTPKPGEQPNLFLPAAPIAGAVAGISSTLCTYPLELLKTRITVQRGVYKNLLDAFMKIVKEEGPAELYRGLIPSLIGVIPYAATNYYAYDTLRKAYKRFLKCEEIGNVATLLIGSAAGAISSSTTFPLEVARKHMQAGALNGRQYKNMLHALVSILEHEGVGGLYRGLGPSCLKLVPAAGISFMVYEACKHILVEDENGNAMQT